MLPVPVLEEAQRDLLTLPGVGMSVMEISHRSKTFDEIIARAENGLRELLSIPDNYRILFLQGGASLQFSMVPINFLPADGSADYVITGSWGKKALKEAKRVGNVNVAATMADGGFTRIPGDDEMSLNTALPTSTSPPTKRSKACNGNANQTPAPFRSSPTLRQTFFRTRFRSISTLSSTQARRKTWDQAASRS